MSYDPKYQEWVENLTKKEDDRSSGSTEIFQVYRGIPVLRVKIRDDPPRYRFLAPVVSGRTRDFNRLCKKIDQRLDKTQSTRVSDKTSRKVATQDSDEVTYFQKWQNCQMELEDMKRREASLAPKLEELQAKTGELSSARTQLQKQVTDLKKQLEASEVTITDLNKKIAQLQSSHK